MPANYSLPYLDFPTAWEIQDEVGPSLAHHPRCSSVPGANGLGGPAFLCDCGAIVQEWKQRKAARGGRS